MLSPDSSLLIAASCITSSMALPHKKPARHLIKRSFQHIEVSLLPYRCFADRARVCSTTISTTGWRSSTLTSSSCSMTRTLPSLPTSSPATPLNGVLLLLFFYCCSIVVNFLSARIISRHRSKCAFISWTVSGSLQYLLQGN